MTLGFSSAWSLPFREDRVGLPPGLVVNRLRWSGFRRLVGRAVPRTDPVLNRRVVSDFDRWALSRLGEPSVVNGMSGYATETLTRASTRGVTVFCDRGSWHILEQKRVLDEEAERIGAASEHFDPFMIDREFASTILQTGSWSRPSRPGNRSSGGVLIPLAW